MPRVGKRRGGAPMATRETTRDEPVEPARRFGRDRDRDATASATTARPPRTAPARSRSGRKGLPGRPGRYPAAPSICLRRRRRQFVASSAKLRERRFDVNARRGFPDRVMRGAAGEEKSRPPQRRLRCRRRQGERERLGVGARPQRVVGADLLQERHGHGVVGHRAAVGEQRRRARRAADVRVAPRCRPCACSDRRQRERAVDQRAGGVRARVGDAQRRVTRGRDDVGRRRSPCSPSPRPG